MNHAENQELVYLTCLKCNHTNVVRRDEYDKTDNKKIECAHCHYVIEKSNYKIVDKLKNTLAEQKNIETGCGIAYILNIADSKRYNLNIGRNLIGRRSNRDFANIVIDTGADKTMSREHAIIDVVESPEGGYSFIIANYKNINATYVNSKLLCKYSTIELFNNDVIKMAKVELMIIICV